MNKRFAILLTLAVSIQPMAWPFNGYEADEASPPRGTSINDMARSINRESTPANQLPRGRVPTVADQPSKPTAAEVRSAGFGQLKGQMISFVSSSYGDRSTIQGGFAGGDLMAAKPLASKVSAFLQSDARSPQRSAEVKDFLANPGNYLVRVAAHVSDGSISDVTLYKVSDDNTPAVANIANVEPAGPTAPPLGSPPMNRFAQWQKSRDAQSPITPPTVNSRTEAAAATPASQPTTAQTEPPAPVAAARASRFDQWANSRDSQSPAALPAVNSQTTAPTAPRSPVVAAPAVPTAAAQPQTFAEAGVNQIGVQTAQSGELLRVNLTPVTDVRATDPSMRVSFTMSAGNGVPPVEVDGGARLRAGDPPVTCAVPEHATAMQITQRNRWGADFTTSVPLTNGTKTAVVAFAAAPTMTFPGDDPHALRTERVAQAAVTNTEPAIAPSATINLAVPAGSHTADVRFFRAAEDHNGNGLPRGLATVNNMSRNVLVPQGAAVMVVTPRMPDGTKGAPLTFPVNPNEIQTHIAINLVTRDSLAPFKLNVPVEQATHFMRVDFIGSDHQRIDRVQASAGQPVSIPTQTARVVITPMIGLNAAGPTVVHELERDEIGRHLVINPTLQNDDSLTHGPR